MKKFIPLAGIILALTVFSGCNETVDKPDACFTPTKTVAKVNDLIGFNDCSVGADSYLWDFGDDSTSTEISPVHSYKNAGQFVVKLTVSNDGGEDVTNAIIEIEIPTPVACFTIRPTIAEVNIPVSFTNCSQHATSYSWDFNNDGTVDSELENLSVTFTSAGLYTIKLTATNEGGFNEVTHQLEVNLNSGEVDPELYNMPVNWLEHYSNEFNTEDDWTSETTADYSTLISESMYTITNYNKTYSWFFGTNAIGIPASTENYDIEIALKIGYDNLNGGDGLFWALDPVAFEYYLYAFTVYEGIGRYIFGDHETGWISNWGTGGNATGYNKLTVRKYGEMYYLFLNEVLVHTQNYGGDFGDDFGFFAGPDSQMLADWIAIWKVDSGSPNVQDGKLFIVNELPSSHKNSRTFTAKKHSQKTGGQGNRLKMKLPTFK